MIPFDPNEKMRPTAFLRFCNRIEEFELEICADGRKLITKQRRQTLQQYWMDASGETKDGEWRDVEVVEE